MGYNSQCYYQNCIYNCCDYWGDCVSSYSDCYYYYNQAQPGVIAGAVIGSVIGVALIIALACYCYRKRQQDQLREEIMRQNANNPNNGTTIVMQMPNQAAYAQPYYPQNPPYGQPYPPQNAPYGQPIQQQPAYFGGASPAYYNGPPMGQPVYNPQQNSAFAY